MKMITTKKDDIDIFSFNTKYLINLLYLPKLVCEAMLTITQKSGK